MLRFESQLILGDQGLPVKDVQVWTDHGAALTHPVDTETQAAILAGLTFSAASLGQLCTVSHRTKLLMLSEMEKRFIVKGSSNWKKTEP